MVIARRDVSSAKRLRGQSESKQRSDHSDEMARRRALGSTKASR